jgi:acetylornithine/succinyldiaminopimelate/putrescine aminotransferase
VATTTARAIAAACKRTGTLLIADEVQSGSWRTGTFLHSGTVGLAPDLVALGKALGAGMPVGAALVSNRIAQSIAAGDHGTTYGGNLLACRAALTFLDVMESGVVDSLRTVSAHLFAELHAIASRHKDMPEAGGAGLIAGLDPRSMRPR